MKHGFSARHANQTDTYLNQFDWCTPHFVHFSRATHNIVYAVCVFLMLIFIIVCSDSRLPSEIFQLQVKDEEYMTIGNRIPSFFNLSYQGLYYYLQKSRQSPVINRHYSRYLQENHFSGCSFVQDTLVVASRN